MKNLIDQEITALVKHHYDVPTEWETKNPDKSILSGVPLQSLSTTDIAISLYKESNVVVNKSTIIQISNMLKALGFKQRVKRVEGKAIKLWLVKTVNNNSLDDVSGKTQLRVQLRVAFLALGLYNAVGKAKSAKEVNSAVELYYKENKAMVDLILAKMYPTTFFSIQWVDQSIQTVTEQLNLDPYGFNKIFESAKNENLPPELFLDVKKFKKLFCIAVGSEGTNPISVTELVALSMLKQVANDFFIGGQK